MYRCENCSQVVAPRTLAIRITIETREKKYPFRSKANRVMRMSETGKMKEVFIDDPGGAGREIAGEMVVCPPCAQTLEKM